MSIWGKVIGVAAGFALGGPLGAILGAVAGHAVDRAHVGQQAAGDLESRQIAFTIAVVVLSAKMAKADGVVTRDEIAAFKQMFQIAPEDMAGVGRMFDEAKRDAQGYEPYAQQIAGMFRHQPAVLEELLGGLYHIAMADGSFHPKEREFLAGVAGIFGFDEAAFARVLSRFGGFGGGVGGGDPYQVLGVTRAMDADAIKQVYRRLCRENHPDTLMAQGLPAEMIDLATEKMAAINAAYDAIAKERGL